MSIAIRTKTCPDCEKPFEIRAGGRAEPRRGARPVAPSASRSSGHRRRSAKDSRRGAADTGALVSTASKKRPAPSLWHSSTKHVPAWRKSSSIAATASAPLYEAASQAHRGRQRIRCALRLVVEWRVGSDGYRRSRKCK